MKHAGLIGYPLDHSISPAIHNAAYEAMAIEADYEAWSMPADAVEGAVRRLRESDDALGLQVTVPHKQAVMAFIDEIDVTAKAIGAVNTIEKRDGRLIGHNTDKAGFMTALVEAGFQPKGKSVLLLGYGGAERAIAFGLAEAGTTSIAIAGRRQEGVAQAVAQLRATSPFPMNLESILSDDERSLKRACDEADLIVNCTPIGMRHSAWEDCSPLPDSALHAGHWVCDAVYNPRETVLLRQARAAGARTVEGLGMLVLQAAGAIELWTGRRAPVNIMMEAAIRALPVKE